MRDKFLRTISIISKLVLLAVGIYAINYFFGIAFTGIALAAVGGVIIPGSESDSHAVRDEIPELNLADIAKEVSMFNPSRFLMDTLFRRGGFGFGGKVGKATSLVKRFYGFNNTYLTDTLADSGATAENSGTTSATPVKSYTYTTGDGQTFKWIAVNNSDNWAPDNLLVIRDLPVSPTGVVAASGLTAREDVVFFVDEVATGAIKIRPLNGIKGLNALANTYVMPNFTASAVLNKIGNAKSEKDLTDTSVSYYPTPDINYCQYFIKTVSESLFQQKQAKEVDWDIKDMIEVAIYNLRAEIEGSTLWGVPAEIISGNKRRYTMKGITRFIQNKITYTNTGITQADMLNLFKTAFTGNNGSDKKLLIAGANYLTKAMAFMLSNTTYMRTKTEVEWGVTMRKWETDFGIINVAHHPLLTELGWSDKAILLDMEKVHKAEFQPFTIKPLDMIGAVISNEIAYSLSEVSTVWLDNPDVHFIVEPV